MHANNAVAAEQMLPADMQYANEHRYCRRFINGYIDKLIRETPEYEAKVSQGVSLLTQWLAGEYHDSKKARLAQLDPMNLEQMVRDVYINLAYYQVPELFVSVTAQLASRMGFSDHRDSILTMAEVVGVLCQTDAYDIGKASPQSSMMVKSRFVLPPDLLDACSRAQYLPPMVSEPQELTSNYQSPYLTFNDSLILGKDNSHGGDICLDIINQQNQIALKLDIDFLRKVDETPTHDLDTQEKGELWETFKKQSQDVYLMLIQQGNKFWLTNKVDKRGRLYAQGYHVSSQGTPFKKAMLELHHEEVVEGVPPCRQQPKISPQII